MTDIPIVVGVVRPTRPARPIAEAEARVIRNELSRRLGTVTCDLRVDGAPVGPWTSRRTAAWPADIDVEIDSDGLWRDDLPPLTALFGRTVDSTAAEVRGRMLTHLGIGGRPLDDTVLDDPIPWRPTDLWLLARRDGVADGSSPELVALADDDGSAVRLDAAFDDVAATVRSQLSADRSNAQIARLRARIAELESQLADEADRRERERVETATRIDDLVAVNEILQEQVARRLLDPAEK